MRNEEEFIAECLISIAANNYPVERYEVILVDDHSTDRTVELASSLKLPNLKILRLEDYTTKSLDKAHKKEALKLAIEKASYPLILQTDGDCNVHPDWIKTMTAYLKENDIVTGPIKIAKSRDFLSSWQFYDGVMTVVGTFLGIGKKMWYNGNAGNFAFHKSDLLEFADKGKNPGSSGDDIFFLNWMSRQKKNIAYAKSQKAIVTTRAEGTLVDLFRQRIRWSTKTKTYSFSGLQLLMSSVFLFYLCLLFSVILLPIYAQSLWFIVCLGLLVKWITDFIVINASSSFFGEQSSFLLTPLFSFSHIIYVVVIGFLGLFMKNYTWKGRVVQ